MFARTARWVPGTGLAFAVLVAVAAGLTGGMPDKDATDMAWVSYYADAGNRHAEELSFFLVGLAGLCFLQFLGSLRGVLLRAEGEPGRITNAAQASGVAFITLAVAGHVFGTAQTWSVQHFGLSYHVDPQTARVLASVAFLLFVMSLFAAAGMALAVTTIALQWRVFPPWLTWLGALAILGGLLGALFFPSVVVLLWIAALSVWMLLPDRVPPGAPMLSQR
jgi:hypothetical protein